MRGSNVVDALYIVAVRFEFISRSFLFGFMANEKWIEKKNYNNNNNNSYATEPSTAIAERQRIHENETQFFLRSFSNYSLYSFFPLHSTHCSIEQRQQHSSSMLLIRFLILVIFHCIWSFSRSILFTFDWASFSSQFHSVFNRCVFHCFIVNSIVKCVNSNVVEFEWKSCERMKSVPKSSRYQWKWNFSIAFSL